MGISIVRQRSHIGGDLFRLKGCHRCELRVCHVDQCGRKSKAPDSLECCQ
jgi:hypothetical protein